MIEMKRATENEMPLLTQFCFAERILFDHDTADADFYMLILDGEELLGFSAVRLSSPYTAYIPFLYIKGGKRRQGLGDGLLRATLTQLTQLSIEQVLVEGSPESEGFLAWEGLTPVKESTRGILYQCALADFFNQGCRSQLEE